MTEVLERKLERAEALHQQGEFAAAEKLAREALCELDGQSAETAADALRSLALISLADSLWQRGMTTEAEPFAREALAVAQRTDAPESRALQAKAWNSIGSIFWLRSMYERAFESFLRALALHEELDNQHGIAIITGNMGVLCKYVADYPRALEYYNRALEQYTCLGDERNAAVITGNIGIIYAKIADYPAALEYYGKALEAYQRHGDNDGAALVSGNIGLLYAELFDYSRALDYYGRSLAIHEEIGNRRGAALCCCNIGQAYLNNGDFSRAEEFLSRSLVEYRSIGEKAGVALVASNIGAVLAKQGKYSDALRQFFTAREEYAAVGEQSGVAAALGSIGALYADNSSPEYDPAKAEQYLTEALGYSRELGTKNQSVGILRTLAALYEQTGNPRALEIFKQFHDLEKQVQSEEAVRTAQLYEHQRQVAGREKLLAVERARNDERERIIGELTLLNAALKEANREKNEVIGIVAHDLKNPLAGILLVADNYRRFAQKMPANEVEKQVDMIAAAARKMTALVMNLLDVQRLDEGRFHIEIAPVSATSLVEASVASHSVQAAAKHIRILTALPAGEILAAADTVALSEVIDNLLSNAIKFSPANSVISVEVACLPQERVSIAVRDEGPGLTEEDKQKLFGKFMRLSARPTGGEHSTGLGLSIVKKLVEAMQGTIRCESEPGRGAAFTVELPLHR